MTYRELKAELDGLTDEQLDQTASFSGEENTNNVYGLCVLDADYYDPSGDGSQPEYDFTPDEIAGCTPCARKGQVFITGVN
jgi:hypothetical protein